MTQALSFLTFVSPLWAVRWGLLAERVSKIERASTWSESVPLSIEALWGCAPAEGDRVLVIEGEHARFALAITGELQLCSLDSARLRRLPAWLWQLEQPSLIVGLHQLDGQRPVAELDLLQLEQVLLQHSANPTGGAHKLITV